MFKAALRTQTAENSRPRRLKRNGDKLQKSKTSLNLDSSDSDRNDYDMY